MNLAFIITLIKYKKKSYGLFTYVDQVSKILFIKKKLKAIETLSLIIY